MKDDIKILSDEKLEKVVGGAVDWQLFGVKFMEALSHPIGTITDEHKQLVAAVKEKNYVEVAIIATSLLSKGDEIVKKVVIECM